MRHYIEGKSLRQYCKDKGLNCMSVYERMREKYETPEEAVNHIRTRTLYNGKTRAQVCKEKGVSYGYCAKLMQFKGMTLEKAVGYLEERKK